MTKKSAKRRIRKSKRTVKRGIRHKIIPQPPNPSSTSARAQMLANPFLPIALSQTPQNVNLDAIHNMRNQNDLRQQQINDTKREKDDELARKKYLDEQERKMKKATKEAEIKYNEEKKKRELMERQVDEMEKQIKKAELEKEEANRLTDTYREMTKKYAGLKNSFDMNELKGKRDFMKAAIAEMEFNIQQQEAEIQQSKIKKEIDDLEAKNKMLDERKKQVSELSQKYQGDVGLTKLVKAQHENNLKNYRNKVAEQRLKVMEDNYNLKAKMQAALTKEEMDKINKEEQDKITAAVQENIRLEEAIKDQQLSQNVLNEQRKLLGREMINKVHLNADLDRLSESVKVGEDKNFDDDLQKSIIVNTRKQKQIEQNKELERARKKQFESFKKEQEAEAASNYYMTQESILLQNQIVEAEKQAVMMDRKTEELNNVAKANDELRRSSFAQSRAKYALDNNDASLVSQVAFIEEELSKAKNADAEYNQRLQFVKNSINERYRVVPQAIINEFYARNPKYQAANMSDVNTLSLQYLQELDQDLGKFIDYKNNNPNL